MLACLLTGGAAERGTRNARPRFVSVSLYLRVIGRALCPCTCIIGV